MSSRKGVDGRAGIRSRVVALCHKTDGTSPIYQHGKKYTGKEHVKVDGNQITVVVDDALYSRINLRPFKKDYSWFLRKTLMPTMPMKDDEIDYIISFIKSLKD